jgi:DNA-binding NtrC family response regulator
MIRIAFFSKDFKLYPLLSSALGKEFHVSSKSTEESLDKTLGARECDVVLLDLDSNHGSLNERIAHARRIVVGEIPCVVMADDELRPTTAELVRLGAQGYCRKPPSIRDLRSLLYRIQENILLKRKLEKVQQRLDEAGSCDQMIGHSAAMQTVYDLVRRVANLNASVLVCGESGTGKELIASAIHNLGARSEKPFVAVSCGAIPETLIESELFGHEKGAFTGTAGAREGYLEQAADGTLFLDEIGELSMSVQVKLLRVLQQREYSRLGTNKLLPLRARIIFATHRDLSEMVAQGKFRQDLYYRINVIKITAPPLSEHAEDIPAIAMHLLRRYSEMYEKPITDFEPRAMSAMQSFTWPGNVRELENVIQRAIILAEGEAIRLEDLPQNLREEDVIGIDDYHPAGTFDLLLRDYKLKLAMAAVRENNGNKTMAARSLNISRAYLHRLLRPTEPAEKDIMVTLLEPEFNTAEIA